MLIDSVNTRWVEVRRKDATGAWLSSVYSGTQDVPIATIGLTMPIAAIYEDSDV